MTTAPHITCTIRITLESDSNLIQPTQEDIRDNALSLEKALRNRVFGEGFTVGDDICIDTYSIQTETNHS